MKAFFATLGVAFASAVLPFINIEAYLGALGAADRGAAVLWVSFAAAFGQTAGKVVLYFLGDRVMRLKWIAKKMATDKWQASYAKWQAMVHERPGRVGLVLFASASAGFPPLLVIAVLAGQLRINIWLFVATVLAGRWIRFAILLGAAHWLVGLFG